MFEDLSPSSSVKLPDTSEASVGRILHEMEALNAVLGVVEGQGDVDEARLLCRTYLARLNPESIEESVALAALQRILGQTVEVEDEWSGVRAIDSWEQTVARKVASAWLAWAVGDSERAQAEIRELRTRQKERERFAGKSGALHLLTLYFWSEAVLHLAAKDPEGAKRFYKRALDYGAQLGTDSHDMISWAYAASFFT